MTYFQKSQRSHAHRWFVDSNSGDSICLCGKLKGKKEMVTGSKYRNIPQMHNGVTYHSQFEAEVAADLDFQIHLKKIMSWERQVKLDLKVNGMHINNYYIDFIAHYADGHRDFIEAKGMELEPWKTNWKILEATFDDFKNHPDDKLVLIKQSRDWKKSYAKKK